MRFFAQFFHDSPDAMLVLPIRRMNNERQRQTDGVNGCVAFSTCNLLTCVIASLFAVFDSTDRLAVNNRGCRCCLFPGRFSHPLPQGIMDSLPGFAILPLTKHPVHGTSIREIDRQHLPLASSSRYFEDRIDDPTSTNTFPDPPGGLWQQLAIRQVTGIIRVHFMLRLLPFIGIKGWEP